MNRAEEVFHMQAWEIIRSFKRPDALAFHVPNGEKRNRSTAAKLKRMGVVSGVADFCIVVDGRCHFVELKTSTGRQAPAQKSFAALAEAAGASYWIVRHMDDLAFALNSIGACSRLFITASGVHGGPGAQPAGRASPVSPDYSPRGTGAPA